MEVVNKTKIKDKIEEEDNKVVFISHLMVMVLKIPLSNKIKDKDMVITKDNNNEDNKKKK